MDLSADMVKIVIKAPNQKVADHTVDCAVGWTIRKLKEHLSNFYPSKPEQNQQRIIYSGKLLTDNVVLKDVLRKYDPTQTTHTVHLVCSSTTSSDGPNITSATFSTSASMPTPEPPHTSGEGLRHRHSPTTTAEPTQPSETAGPAPPPVSSAAGNPQPFGVGNAFMFGGAEAGGPAMQNMPMMMPGMMYSPEQMMWMQQMYAQQMAQYMQYFQQGAAPPSSQAEMVNPDPAAAVAANQNAPNMQAANQAAPAGNQPVRMAAGGGAMFADDDDEDEVNRDWLDWLYTSSRFAVLLSIVYFYSTLGRFVMVFGFLILVYLYQGGWLRLRRRNNPDAEEVEVQAQPAEDVVADPQPPDAEESQAPEDADVNNPLSPPTETSHTETVPPPPPPPPGTLKIAWAFVSTFFTSLVPQPPALVNAN